MVRAKRSKNGGFGWLYCKSLETAIIILPSLFLFYSHCSGDPLANTPSLLPLSLTHKHTRANIPNSDWQNIVTHALKHAHRKKMPANICRHFKRRRKKAISFLPRLANDVEVKSSLFWKVWKKSRQLQNDVSSCIVIYRVASYTRVVYFITRQEQLNVLLQNKN